MRRIVLVRPAGPRNVGASLRAATNFGPAELYAVAPERPALLRHPDFEQMAHGVADYRERVTVVEDLPGALGECTWVVGLTARTRDHADIRDWREVRGELAERSADPAERVAFLFGNEVTGLSGAECGYANLLARIPTTDEHTSLNLATTAALVLYDTYLPGSPPTGEDRTAAVTGHAREYLKAHVGETLVSAARSDPIRAEIAASVQRVFSKAPLETRDARAWHAVMRALGNRKSPLDYGLGPEPAPEESSR